MSTVWTSGGGKNTGCEAREVECGTLMLFPPDVIDIVNFWLVHLVVVNLTCLVSFSMWVRERG